ncbi:integrase catalytic domain-containing protein [Trichonephila clavipes]|nr:integrase catalytic domain-containing protein [Trichonephila clavipes]
MNDGRWKIISDKFINESVYPDTVKCLLDIQEDSTSGPALWNPEDIFSVNLSSGWIKREALKELKAILKWRNQHAGTVHRNSYTERSKRKISDLWEFDSLGIKDPSEKKSKLELQDLALKHFENTVLRDDEDWKKEGIIEKIAQDEPKIGGKFHYLPHRLVFKENSTTKICPAFDGSAHQRKSGSLNDCVEKRPNLIEMIRAILNRFRLGKIGVISDIRKSFPSDIFA